jgi:hypothetical protein
MKELTQIYKDSGKQLIDDLFKDYLVVTEKLSGSSFSFQRKGDGVEFYKGGNQRPINLIDRTLMVYYEKPISYIKSVVSKNFNSIPENWKFCFQYFVNNQPSVITYDRMPKNHLVLTHIKVMAPSGNVMKVIEDPRVINDWSNALGVTPLLPLFKGYLTDVQKQKIKEFLNTPKEDHAEIFNTNSFAEYLLRILNPSIQSTTLQHDLKKPIESIIFKFYKAGTRQNVAAKLIDPYTVNLMKDKEPIDLRKAPADINEIILLDLLAFIEERGIKKHEILGDTEDMRYIELVSNIFNDYVTKRGKDITKIDIEKAEFAKGDEFDLNVELIPSQRTKDILNENPQLKDLFKIMVGSLKKKRKNGGNIMTPSVINDFNQMVDKVIDVIQPDEDDSFKTFDDYLKIKSTNESLLPTAEEMIVEERTLLINEFINLNKIDLIKNQETMKFLKNYDSYHESKVNEKNITVSLDKEVVGMIDQNDTSAIDTIRRIAGSSEGKEDVKAFLSTIGIPSDRHDEIITLLGGGDWAKGSSYLLNRTLSVSKILGKKMSSFDVNKTLLGITDKKLSDKLFSFQWPTQPPMGKGEAWLALMIEGGSKAGVGDVEINGMNTEVKGVGARLVGQHGYGDAKRMGDHLRSALVDICANLGIDYTPPTGSGLDWSITKKEGRLLGSSLKEMAKIKGGFSNKDIQLISSSIINAYKNLYTALQTTKYSNVLTGAIKKDGSLDTNRYNIEMIKMSFDYYHQVEQFTYFAMTNNNTGNFLIITPSEFSSLVENNTIKYSPQSWGERSGTQGGYFAIAIDKLSK